MNTVSTRLFGPDFQQPLAGAIARKSVRGPAPAAGSRPPVLQLGTQGLGQIGHLLEIVSPVLVQPVQHLLGAEGLLADAFEESDDPLEIEQIGR
jgi:hypothetical protein